VKTKQYFTSSLTGSTLMEKDATLLTEHDAQTGKYYHKTELQEHIVVVGEPGACHLTHVSPQDGRGITIANEVYDAIIKGTD